MYTFDAQYEIYLNAFNAYLDEWCEGFVTRPAVLGESMKYSLKSGGKRIRPVLMLAVCDMLGGDMEEALPFALALEMIHTYSLVHDDLPAMDNDDFRRGKPTNHKVFGEAGAVLAGDGLLNTAYSVCFRESQKGEKFLRAARELCEAAGAFGMIAGQSADLEGEKVGEATEDELSYIYENKTGKLLCAPIRIASILAGGKHYFELDKFGYAFGMLFQLTDDILDEVGQFEKLGKSIGKDKNGHKLTGVRVYGLAKAKVRADVYAADCYASLDAVEGDTSFLRNLVSFTRNREV